jgi:hypothetical protein
MKKDKHPFSQEIQIYDKGAKVQNRFGGDSIELNALELSIYDTLMGCEQFQRLEKVIDLALIGSPSLTQKLIWFY